MIHSKQGRKIDDIDKDVEITLVYKTQWRYGDEEMFDTGVLDGDEVLAEPKVTVKDVNLIVDEVTLAQALAALKSAKVQEKANVKAHDKGKGIMVEEHVKIKKKDQISLDEELAFKLQTEEEEEEEERLARVKPQREEEANIVSWDKCAKNEWNLIIKMAQLNSSKNNKRKEVATDAIPLATKPPSIIDYKIYKEGNKTYYQIIRADGSSKMYLVFSHMLKSFNMEDLETLWKLVKAKHRLTRPEEGYERVLWGNLKTMFDPHVKDQVWRDQSDYRVLD
ncbi:hypothetical protein Tco_0084321 [Tanacetum coccineum]